MWVEMPYQATDPSTLSALTTGLMAFSASVVKPA